MTADASDPDGEPAGAAPSPWAPGAPTSADTAGAGAGVEPTDPDDPPAVVLTRTPRVGELAPGWRLVTAVTWIAVAVAIGSVWKTSDQLGLSTWWIGPRGQPNPRFVQVLPFAPALVMLVGAINQWRRLAAFGVVAALAVVAIGIGDIGRVTRLGVVEMAVGAAAMAVSIASFTGTYRLARPTDDDTSVARAVESADAG